VRTPASTWSAVPLRAVLVLAASGGLHWGVWQATGAPAGRASGAVPVPVPVTMTMTVTVTPMWVVPGAGPQPTAGFGVSQAAGPGEGVLRAYRIGAPPPARPVSLPPAASVGPVATPARGAAARPTAAPAGGKPPEDTPAIAWLEVWDVDEPPQFLVAPDDLEGLARHVGWAVRARVSLRIGTDGRLAGLELDVDGLDAAVRAALHEALETSFAPLVFLPGRRDGRPVPVVQRWELALDPQVPVALGMAPVN